VVISGRCSDDWWVVGVVFGAMANVVVSVAVDTS